MIENQKSTDHDDINDRKRQTQFTTTENRKLMGVNVKPEQNRNELMYSGGGGEAILAPLVAPVVLSIDNSRKYSFFSKKVEREIRCNIIVRI